MNGLSSFGEPQSKQERQERRVRLEKDREVVRSQLAGLRQRLPQLQRGSLQTPSKQGGVSKKRPASTLADLPGDAKRQKVEAERAKRVNSIWLQCQTILKTLMKSKDSFAFSKPVNPITAKCPDYHDIIKRPMDLGTIQKKFPGKGKATEKRELQEYRTPLQFRDDVRLVWANCRTYNAVGHAVRTMGDALSETWEKKWVLSGLEAKWEDEVRRQELEEQHKPMVPGNKFSREGEIRPRKRCLDTLRDVQMEELAGGTSVAQQMHNVDASLQHRVRQAELQAGGTPPREGSAMSFEQKRRLSIAIGQLAGDKISDVVRIIVEDSSMQDKADLDEEVEVDIDQLSDDILWKLERYVTNALQAAKKKAVPKPGTGPRESAEPAAANGQSKDIPNGGRDAAPAHNSSSSSSSDSDTDPHSDSEGEVGSKDLGASQHSGGAAPAAHRGGGNDAATLVSATRPPGQPQIVKNMASKKEVNLRNANAWADLGAGKAEDAPAEGGGDGDGEDGLWDEFKSREQEEEQREKERRDELARHQAEQQKAEEAARAEAERLKKEAEAEEEEKKAQEEARINAEREQELQEMQKGGQGAEFAARGIDMDSKRHGDTLTDVLGLQRRDSDSDNDSDDED